MGPHNRPRARARARKPRRFFPVSICNYGFNPKTVCYVIKDQIFEHEDEQEHEDDYEG